MSLILHRSNRTVFVTGPDGGPPPTEAANRLVDRLTYFPHRYVRESNSYETFEERLYAFDANTRLMVFPLGMLPSVCAHLSHLRVPHQVVGKTISELNPRAHTPDVEAVLREFTPRKGQPECLASVAAAESGQINAATGFGKSAMIRMICVMYPRAKIHVVAKSADVAANIHTELIRHIPDAGIVGGGNRKRGRVTVFVAASLHHGAGEADILLGDECHELVTPMYAGLLGLYRNTRFFGFTATPTGRHDGRDPEIEAIFGPPLFSLSYQEAEADGLVVPITVEWLDVPEGPDVTGLLPIDREKYGIWRNDVRNGLIAERVRRVDPAAQTLVMTSTIDHAVRLKALLPDFTLCYSHGGMDGSRIEEYQAQGLLPPDEPVMTKARREDLRRRFAAGSLRRVISNYVWSTGVDFPHLSVLVRADAGGRGKEIKDYQIPGRSCRVAPGTDKEASLVIDCWDRWDESMLGRSRGRRRNYQARGWAQVFQPGIRRRAT